MYVIFDNVGWSENGEIFLFRLNIDCIWLKDVKDEMFLFFVGWIECFLNLLYSLILIIIERLRIIVLNIVLIVVMVLIIEFIDWFNSEKIMIELNILFFLNFK